MQPQPVFDAAAARADGVSDSDIAAFLAPRMNFDLEAAHKDGVPDSNIVNFLAPAKAAPEPPPEPASAPSLTDRVWNAMKANASRPSAFGEGLKEGFQPEQPLEELAPDTEKLLGRIGLAPTDNNVNLFNQTTHYLARMGNFGVQLAGRAFEGLLHGGANVAERVLTDAGVEAGSARDMVRDIAGGIETEATRGGEIPFHQAAHAAREFTAARTVNVPSQTPKATPADVLAAPDIDTAIARASEAAQSEPQDIEAEGMKAEAAARASEQAAPVPVAAEIHRVEPTTPETAKPASEAAVTAETKAPPHEEIPLPETAPEGPEAEGPTEPAEPAFDRLKYLTQARSYVIKGKGSLKPDAVAQALGIEPEQAAQVMGALASQPESGLIVTANGTLRRSPTYSGAQDLIQWIGRHGGIARDSDMEAMDAHRILIPGGGPLARNTGRDADYVREAVNQEGYGPYQTINELYAAIDDNLRGNRQFRTGEAPEERGYDETEHEQYLDQRGAALGIERDPAWTLDQYDEAITKAEARRTPTHTLPEVDAARQAEADGQLDEIRRGLLDEPGMEEYLGAQRAAAARTGTTGGNRETVVAPEPVSGNAGETASPEGQAAGNPPDVAAAGTASGTGEAGSTVAPEGTIDLGGVRVSPNDLSYDLAYRAHAAMSFTPEVRARQVQKEYVDDLRNLYDRAAPTAETDSQRAILASELERYRQGFLTRYRDVLSARSRTASPMITGPSKFPTARNEKALNAEQNRVTEFLDWRKRAQAAVFHAVDNARSGEQVARDGWEDLKGHLDRDIGSVRDIDNGAPYDRTAFTNSVSGRLERLANNGETDLVNKALSYIREKQAELKKPFFTDRHSVWALADRAKAKAEVPTETGERTVAEFEGATVVRNADDDRVRITMEARPSPEIRDALKGEGWHWSPSNGAWQRKATPAAEQSATRILGKFYKPKEAEPEPRAVAAPKFALAYHGSPYDFDQFSNDAIGSGEGAAAYGWGHYFAGKKEVAEYYRDALTKGKRQFLYDGKPVNPRDNYYLASDLSWLERSARPNETVPELIDRRARELEDTTIGRSEQDAQLYRNAAARLRRLDTNRLTMNTGKLFHVDLKPSEDAYLDWDKPMTAQSEQVKEALRRGGWDIYGNAAIRAMDGGEFYRALARQWDGQDGASRDLHEHGIPGIKYRDAGSRVEWHVYQSQSGKWTATDRGPGGAGHLEQFDSEKEAHDYVAAEQVKQTHNYVIFDPSHIAVQAKFARAKPLTDIAERKQWVPKSEVTPEGTRLIYRPEFAARSAQLAASLKAELGKMGLGKIAVRVADQIRNEAGGTSANAYYFRRMITMALDTENPLRILNHEVIHALRDMGLFTDGEWRILEAEARRKWLHDPEIADRLKRYSDVSDAERLEESIAMAAERGLEANPSPFATRIFSRLRDFFRSLGNALKGYGFATPESIFRGIREGEFGERLKAEDAARAERAASFALRPHDNDDELGDKFNAHVDGLRGYAEQFKAFPTVGKSFADLADYLEAHGPLAIRDMQYKALLAKMDDAVANFKDGIKNPGANVVRPKFAKSDEPTTEPGAPDAKGKPLPQTVMPGMEKSAKQAAASREAEGKIQPKSVQKAPGGLFADKAPPQADLFGGKPRFAYRNEDELTHDQVSGLIAAAGHGGENGKGPSITERDAPRIALAGIKQLKNLNYVEADTIFPRMLGSLDDLSARFWNAWEKRSWKANENVKSLRGIISDSLAQLPADSRNRVYAGLELARKFNWRPADDGTPIRVRNTSYWQAQKSKPGDNFVLNAQETRALHDTLKLGDDGWRMFMQALARREGWAGEVDPKAIREAANAKEGLPEGRKLLRLASALEQAQAAMNRPYFPASRFGDYFIAVRPKKGVDTESLGGFPEVEWFQTVEKPALDDMLGLSRRTPENVKGVRAAIANIRSIKKPDGSLAFPPETHAIETGDLRSRPSILRQLNIPAIEKLFMLMERGVTEHLTQNIMGEGEGRTEAKAAAKGAYEHLQGEAKDALLDAIYHDMLAGFKKQAKLVPGYDADFDKAITSHLGHIARNAADMEHRAEIDSAYQDISDNHPHQAVKTYWKHWREYQESPRASILGPIGSLSRIGATYVMGLNPATTMMISAHTPMMAVPVLSVGGNLGQATAQMLRSLREVYGALSFDKARGATIATELLGKNPREKALIAELDKSGLNHSLGADDIRALNDRQAGLWGEAAPVMRKALDISMSNVSAVDQANRNAIALATFRMALNPATLSKMAKPWLEHNAIFRDIVEKDGLTPETFTKFMMDQAAGSWGRMNQAPVMRGAEGSLLFALHGFQTRYLSTAFNLMKNMGPEGKIAAGWMMGALWFAAGAYGLPFTQDLETAGDHLIKGITGVDPMIDAHLRQFLSDTGMGKIGSEILLRGPLSVMLGTDLSSRIGFGDIIARNFGDADFMGTIPAIMYQRLNAAYTRARNGQGVGAAATELLPSALRNPARAAIESSSGAMSAHDRMAVPAPNLSNLDLARQSIGLTPLKVEQSYSRAEYDQRLKERFNDLREQTVNSAALMILHSEEAAKGGKQEEAQKISSEMSALISEYNKTHWQSPVTGQELSNAILQLTNPEIARRLRMPKAYQGQAQNSPYP